MECAFRRQNKHTIRRCQRTRIAMLINQHSNSSLYREQQSFPNSISGQDCRAAKVEPICLLAIRRMHIYRRWLSYATAHMNELCKFEEGKKKKTTSHWFACRGKLCCGSRKFMDAVDCCRRGNPSTNIIQHITHTCAVLVQSTSSSSSFSNWRLCRAK